MNALTDEARFSLVLARDPRADGQFFYGVATTGVFCRPACGARAPRRENVSFHASARDAVAAGFRACKRCRPHEAAPAERRAAVVADLCHLIDAREEAPDLAALAAHAGLSPSHLHRMFKAATGVTPRAYAEAARARRVRDALAAGEPVTRALYDAGFGSSGRFYEASDGILGMTPSRYRAGAPDVEIRFAVGACSLGALLVAATTRGVCAISLGDDPDALVRELEQRFRRARLVGGDEVFETIVARVVGLVERPHLGASLPLDLRGTAFQIRVWKLLGEIPAGTTVTYTQLALSLGSPRSVRAVARACAANPVAVAVPCHRVVRVDGDLAGYRWGIDRKRALLARESARGALRRCPCSTQIPRPTRCCVTGPAGSARSRAGMPMPCSHTSQRSRRARPSGTW